MSDSVNDYELYLDVEFDTTGYETYHITHNFNSEAFAWAHNRLGYSTMLYRERIMTVVEGSDNYTHDICKLANYEKVTPKVARYLLSVVGTVPFRPYLLGVVMRDSNVVESILRSNYYNDMTTRIEVEGQIVKDAKAAIATMEFAEHVSMIKR